MNRKMFNLIRAIKTEDPPCTGCEWFNKCSRNNIACAMFKNYVEYGKSIGDNNPTKEIYKELFKDVGFRILKVSYS
jgi:hypothetical protein